jgi:hypothetical protein
VDSEVGNLGAPKCLVPNRLESGLMPASIQITRKQERTVPRDGHLATKGFEGQRSKRNFGGAVRSFRVVRQIAAKAVVGEPGRPDAVHHFPMGAATQNLFDIFGVQKWILQQDSDIDAIIADVRVTLSCRQPAAIILMAIETVTKEYANSLGKVKVALQIVLDRLNKPQPQRDKAVEELSHAVEQWSNQVQELAVAAPDQGERDFLRAAAEVRAGQLVLVAAQAAEAGDEKALREKIGLVESEQQEAESGRLVARFFEEDLLNVSNRPTDADKALEQFKERSIRTLDNMVAETCDVVFAWVAMTTAEHPCRPKLL